MALNQDQDGMDLGDEICLEALEDVLKNLKIMLVEQTERINSAASTILEPEFWKRIDKIGGLSQLLSVGEEGNVSCAKCGCGADCGEKKQEKVVSISQEEFFRMFGKVRKPLPPHRCTHCDKRFELLWDLDKHLKSIHSIERYHACDQCTKMFASVEDFERHRASHGERPFKCGICPVAFLHQQTLQHHLKCCHSQFSKMTTISVNSSSHASVQPSTSIPNDNNYADGLKWENEEVEDVNKLPEASEAMLHSELPSGKSRAARRKRFNKNSLA